MICWPHLNIYRHSKL